MKARQLHKLGVPRGKLTRLTLRLIDAALSLGTPKDQLRSIIGAVVREPGAYVEDPVWRELARHLVPADHPASPQQPFVPRAGGPAPWHQWGEDLDPKAVQQMVYACELPVAVRGALMPDAHVGYGLPIGGVLATVGAVIPYAVGVDIACRMKITVLDQPPHLLQSQPDRLAHAIEEQTRFGVGAEFRGRRRDHAVMDEDWSITPMIANLKDKAWAQLGTSGSGNHFVELGVLSVDAAQAATIGIDPGEYLALMSHSGSRGAGASIASHYSNLAMNRHPELPRELQHLAWLDLDTEDGQAYWQAMQLMGRYAHANHDCIHRAIVRHLGAKVVFSVENHHNFAWEEQHDGQSVIVHRKGATPAGEGVLGVIPGSMAHPAYIVRGKGDDASLRSAAHGAGRAMSRTQAKKQYRWSPVLDYLKHRGVTLLSAGLDEVPFAYKDIDVVMRQQADLVEVVARFDPKLVKMAPAGERPED